MWGKRDTIRAIGRWLTSWAKCRGHRREDPFFEDVPVYRGDVPADLSEEHDRYLEERAD